MREFGSEHPAIILPDGYFSRLSDYGRPVTYVRSGREGLFLVAQSCATRQRPPVILFPAYCCWSMSAPFEKAGWRVVYYRLNKDLTVDLGFLQELLQKYHPAAVLTMNFYGSADTSDAVSLVKAFDKSIAVIEDFSHCTFSFDSIFNPRVDYYVSSIRKSVGVADGAIVIGPVNADLIGKEDTEFAAVRLSAQKQKSEYSYRKDSALKDSFYPALKACEETLDRFNAIHKMSEVSLRMLDTISGDRIAITRRENMRHLWSLLNGKVANIPGIERCFSGAPFSFPILIDNRDEIQQHLARRGVYAPVLWPISDDARSVCQVSSDMADRMLSLPIDQRYGWDDIEEIAGIVIDVICK